MKKFNVAITGIRGAVGDTMFEILKERKFPINGNDLTGTLLKNRHLNSNGHFNNGPSLNP